MLIIDNYDSFTYNIVQYIKILGINPTVIKNDEMSLEEIKKLNCSRIILSPGWGNPDNSGVTMEVIDFYKDKYPILGVCLGMQCIAKYYGGEIVKAPEPYHGKNSEIFFDEDFELFKGFKQGFSATRYHSLMVKIAPSPHFSDIQANAFKSKNYPSPTRGEGSTKQSCDFPTCVAPPTRGEGSTKQSRDFPTCVAPPTRGEGSTKQSCDFPTYVAPPPIKGGSTLYSTCQLQNNKFIQITAWTKDNIPMALKIKNKPIYGVQFHPEAILTEHGIEIFKNFIKI